MFASNSSQAKSSITEGGEKMSKMFSLPIKVFFVLTIVLSVAWAQEEKKPDKWAPFKFFVGKWEGTVKGKYGTAKIEQEF